MKKRKENLRLNYLWGTIRWSRKSKVKSRKYFRSQTSLYLILYTFYIVHFTTYIKLKMISKQDIEEARETL